MIYRHTLVIQIGGFLGLKPNQNSTRADIMPHP